MYYTNTMIHPKISTKINPFQVFPFQSSSFAITFISPPSLERIIFLYDPGEVFPVQSDIPHLRYFPKNIHPDSRPLKING